MPPLAPPAHRDAAPRTPWCRPPGSVSRATVVGWLQRARERGLVRVRLDEAAFAGLLVSTGPNRVASMLAAIRAGYATHVVTSASTAEALLADGGRA